jgi:hypothetical protein
MAREQVQDLPGRIAKPAAVSAGQYRVQVQEAPVSGLTKLASALSNVNQGLVAYSKYQGIQRIEGQKLGELQFARDAAAADTEEKKLELFKTEQKLVDQGLLKNSQRIGFRESYNAGIGRMMKSEFLQELNKGYNDVISPDADDDAVNELIANARGKIAEKLQNNPYALLAFNRIADAEASNFVSQTDRARDAAIQDRARGIARMEVGIELDRITGDPESTTVYADTQLFLASYDDGLKGMYPNPLDRTIILSESVATYARQLADEGQHAKAMTLLDATESVKINGKPVFKSTAAQAQLNQIRNKIEYDKIQDRTRDKKELADRHSDKATNLIGRLNSVTNINEFTEADRDLLNEVLTFQRTVGEKGQTEERLNELQAIVFNPETGTPLQNFKKLYDALGLAGSDTSEEIYFSTQEGIARKLKALDESPLGRGLSPAEKREIVARMEGRISLAGENTPTLAEVRGELLLKPLQFPELQKYYNEMTKGTYVYKTPLYRGLDKSLELIFKTINFEDLEDKEFAEEQVDLFRNQVALRNIKLLLFDKAKEMDQLTEGQPGYIAPTERLKVLQDLADQQQRRYKDVFESLYKISPSEESEIEDTPPRVQKYPSLRKAGWFDKSVTTPAQINQDREEMVKDKDDDSLKTSLKRFGFTKWDEEEIPRLMKAAGLDYKDNIQFFGKGNLEAAKMTILEMNWLNAASRMFGYDMDNNGKLTEDPTPLTKDQKANQEKALMQFQQFGIFGKDAEELIQSIEEFFDIQHSLRKAQ